MTASPSANIELVYSRAKIAAVMTEVLRLFVGRGRKWSVVALCQASGVAERQIESAKREIGDIEHRHLKAEEIASILSVLGVPAQNLYLAHMGTSAFPADPREREAGAIMAMLSQGTAEFIKRGIDGKYDGKDRHELREWADMMAEFIAPFTSKAG